MKNKTYYAYYHDSDNARIRFMARPPKHKEVITSGEFPELCARLLAVGKEREYRPRPSVTGEVSFLIDLRKLLSQEEIINLIKQKLGGTDDR